MNSTLDKILELPEPDWDWSLDDATYSGFSPEEQDKLIALVNEEHLEGKMEDEVSDVEADVSTHAYRIVASFLDSSHIPLFLECLFAPEYETGDLFGEDIIKILPRYQSDAVQPCIDCLNAEEQEFHLALKQALDPRPSEDLKTIRPVFSFTCLISTKLIGGLRNPLP